MKNKAKKKSEPAPKKTKDQPIPKYEIEMVDLAKLKPHPENYRTHPEDQIAHFMASVKQFGVFKNLVVACDYTILAGHGLSEACKRLKITQVPVKKYPFGPEDIRAKKILAVDNELGHLAVIDDRILTTILKSVKDAGELFGTGYDDKMLANLVMVTRHSDEIADINEAAEWVGMPAFENVEKPFKLVISFETLAVRNKLLSILNVGGFSKATGPTLSMWWPQKEQQDLKAIRFKDKAKKGK